MTIMGISFTAWIFYVANLLVIVGYMIVGILLVRPSGLFGNGPRLSRPALVCLEFYLASCLVLHIELAIRAYQDKALVENADGSIDPRFITIIVVKVLLWFAFFAVAAQASKPRERETADE